MFGVVEMHIPYPSLFRSHSKQAISGGIIDHLIDIMKARLSVGIDSHKRQLVLAFFE